MTNPTNDEVDCAEPRNHILSDEVVKQLEEALARMRAEEDRLANEPCMSWDDLKKLKLGGGRRIG